MPIPSRSVAGRRKCSEMARRALTSTHSYEAACHRKWHASIYRRCEMRAKTLAAHVRSPSSMSKEARKGFASAYSCMSNRKPKTGNAQRVRRHHGPRGAASSKRSLQKWHLKFSRVGRLMNDMAGMPPTPRGRGAAEARIIASSARTSIYRTWVFANGTIPCLGKNGRGSG